MKKRILTLTILIITLLGLTACDNKKINESATKFKEEYESLNGKTNSNGKVHRTLIIDENNPYEKVSASDILKKLENKETFYVYFGDKLCPWCRSVIEKSIEIANKNNINKIYYVNIWDDEGNEVLRDKYTLENGEVIKAIEGTSEYRELLEIFDELLTDYTLTNQDGNKVQVGEKRIYAPNFIYIKNGKPIKITEGISDKQKDSREELTDEILNDEEELFSEFFNN